ncbi:uncharacterized protein LOC120287738 [Eucalyptus grandis]|uniref:uncharacterized protein LOC120287738 n=1 Tax=Eucalyptus grandis TaxID=71139 RepID=UPI00192EBA5E|nr:uncharacterized protein LOC120287738 [Eucalyptus grandis]XP_039156999.1 uncharacterized protein LOC120287738 [Eucalyptus grandis]XP_039157000.1 uncharacterized protein LOC120287738 [Eucalyptus grandis]
MMTCQGGMISEKGGENMRFKYWLELELSQDDLGDEDGNLEANGGADSEDSESKESADEFYKQVKQQRAAKLATKAERYIQGIWQFHPCLKQSMESAMSLTRGLTRNRKKQMKSPRKKYRSKHEKAAVR